MTQQINLLNPALRQPRTLLTARNLAAAVGICLVLTTLGGGAARYALHRAAGEAALAAGSVKSAQVQLTGLSARIAARQPDPALQREVDAVRALLQGREEVLAALGGMGRDPGKGFSAPLRGLARRTVRGVWLTGVYIGADNALSLRGRTVSHPLVAEYVKQLTSEPAFAGRRFSQLNMARVAEAGTTGNGKTPPASEPPLEFNLLAESTTALPSGAPINLAGLNRGQP